MPYRKIVTEDVLERIEHSLSEQHVIVNEIRVLRRAHKQIKVVVAIMVAVIVGMAALGGFLWKVNQNQIQDRDQTTLFTCQSRNSSLRDLRASQLEGAIITVDSLLVESDEAAGGPSPERTALAEATKERLREVAMEKELNPAVPDRDCDRDGEVGGSDADDYLDIVTGVEPPPGTPSSED